jgi:hypothetical protein
MFENHIWHEVLLKTWFFFAFEYTLLITTFGKIAPVLASSIFELCITLKWQLPSEHQISRNYQLNESKISQIGPELGISRRGVYVYETISGALCM